MVLTLAFSPNSQVLAGGSADGTIHTWAVATGKSRADYLGHVNVVNSLAFSADGRTLASVNAAALADDAARGTGFIKLWDTERPIGVLRKPLANQVLAQHLSKDGRTLTALDRSGTVHTYDTRTGVERSSVQFGAHGQTGPDRVSPAHAAMLPALAKLAKGAMFASGVIAPDGKTIAMVDFNGTAVLADVASNKELHRLPMPEGLALALTFSPDSKLLAAATMNRLNAPAAAVMLWDVTTGKRTATLPGFKRRVYSVAFSPDGTRLAAASLDHTVRIWDARSHRVLRTITADKGVSAVMFSPDGKKLAMASDILLIHDLATGAEERVAPLYSQHVVEMAFSPDGTRLATAGGEDEEMSRGSGLKVWDLASGQEVLSLGGAADIITHVAFSSDDRRLVATHDVGGMFGLGSAGGEVLIWDAPDIDHKP